MDYNKGYEDFDWSSLSKWELDKLYHAIIDHGLKDPRYLTYVLHKWNISAYEFYQRAEKSYAIRNKRNKKKRRIQLKVMQGLLDYLDTLPGDPDVNYQILRNQVLYVDGNKN